MHKRSFIYRHIYIYRLAMNLLYFGKYKRRFAPVIEHLSAMPPRSKILELCFGDIYIADFCKKAGHYWQGLDINEHFVAQAQRLGFDAAYADLSSNNNLPEADVCVMMGSLYQFHSDAEAIVTRMLTAAKMAVISEPVSNLSSKGGIIGYLAKRSANAGKGTESFRYNRETFMELLDQCRRKSDIKTMLVQDHGKDIIVKLSKNGNHQP